MSDNNLLDSVEVPDDRPIICTITGDGGLGKTTLASCFPNPIVIRAEDGLQSLKKELRPSAFPLLQGVSDLWAQLGTLINQDHEYETLVIDSTSALERMFIDDVLASDPKAKSINQALGGYGAGMSAVAAMHGRVRKAAGILNAKKGMHIVFVCHADTETMDLPDQDQYTRYSLRLAKKSVAPYVDDVDLVGFLRLETFTKGDGDKKKAFSDGTRIMVCYSTASCISKNRYGITEDITVEEGKNPLVNYVPSLAQKGAK